MPIQRECVWRDKTNHCMNEACPKTLCSYTLKTDPLRWECDWCKAPAPGNHCEICGKDVPNITDPAFMQQGFRQLYWGERGPFYFCSSDCPGHSFEDLKVWIADTLICDRDYSRAIRPQQ